MSTDSRPPLFGPSFDADPYPAYDWLRRNEPVTRVPLPGCDAWLVTRYEDAVATLTHPSLSKDPASASPEWRAAALGLPLDHRSSLARHMLNVDGEDHSRLRRLVSATFTPRRMEELRARAQEITDSLLDRLDDPDRPEADLIAGLAYPLPITIICDLLGVPEENRATFHHHASVIDSAAASQVEDIARATDGLETFLSDLVAFKRTNPGDDLLTELVRRSNQGEIHPDELTSTAFLLLIAGHETTVALIGNGIFTLLRHPEQMAAVRADPALLPDVIDEMLRFDGPVRNATWRFPTEPVVIGGQEMVPGDSILVSLLAANRDPAVFDDPDTFSPGRIGEPHLAFGRGPHYCVGAALAKVEAEVAIGTVLRRFPDLAPAADPEGLTWWPSTIMRGLFSLPVRLRA
ncbi:cytochrome P450 hydroxylase [Planotetraspora thailandica]|uniref:Cytochrome P450 hydroxylase n=1 Tax=Planotetraspora thailandica TaxID=487172 RepID=A0A8J3UZV3_9ACTN|nr:cytochrome P450 [Planotetraspora thailandica]GII52932.1 cytochrome P450 hydroxylase [Planotetraspora thailandica]